MLRLHYAPGTIAVAAAITLEEAGIPYEPVKVDFASGAQRGADYLALNPKGRVPTLETANGRLTEAGAVMEYVASLSAVPLVPADPFRAGQMRELMYFLASTMHVNHAHKLRGHRWADSEASHADMKTRVAGNMSENCAYLEDHYAISPFALGDQLTLADPHLFMLVSWAPGDGVDLAAYPRLRAHQAMMRMRPSVGAVIEKGMLGK